MLQAGLRSLCLLKHLLLLVVGGELALLHDLSIGVLLRFRSDNDVLATVAYHVASGLRLLLLDAISWTLTPATPVGAESGWVL